MTKKFRFPSIFSPALFWQGIQRIRVPGIAMAIAVIGLNVIYPIIAIRKDNIMHAHNTPDNFVNVFSQVDTMTDFAPMLALLLPFALLLTFTMFSYLNSRPKSDFYHSIPQTRLCVFISFCASIVAWLVAVLLGSTLINGVLWSMTRYHSFDLSEIALLLGAVLLGSLFCMSVAALAMTLTGTTVSNLLVTALILIVPPVVSSICADYIERTFAVLRSPLLPLAVDFWDPMLYPLRIMYMMLLMRSEKVSPISALYEDHVFPLPLLVCAVMLILSAYLYHRRRSEAADQSAIHPVLQHIFRCTVAFPLVLFTIYIIAIAQFDFQIEDLWFLILSLILYLLYELATTKKLKNLLCALPMYGLVLLSALLLFGTLHLGGHLAANDIPDRDDIATVSIAPGRFSQGLQYQDYDLTATGDEMIVDAFLDALEFSAPLSQAESFQLEDHINLQVRIKTKLGRTIMRVVDMPKEVWYAVEVRWLQSPSLQQAVLTLPKAREIDHLEIGRTQWTDRDARTLWTLFCNEYAALSPEEQLATINHSSYYRWYLDVYLEGNRYLTTYRLLHSRFPQTVAHILEKTNASSPQDLSKISDHISHLPIDTLREHMGTSQALFRIILQAEDPTGGLTVENAIVLNKRCTRAQLEAYIAAGSMLGELSDPFDFTSADGQRRIYYLEISYDNLYSDEDPWRFPDGQAVIPPSFSCKTYLMLTDAEVAALSEYIRAAGIDE